MVADALRIIDNYIKVTLLAIPWHAGLFNFLQFAMTLIDKLLWFVVQLKPSISAAFVLCIATDS